MTERELPYSNKPVGVGGWLIFYIWGVCLILPFVFVVKILAFLREQDVVENADWFNCFRNCYLHFCFFCVLPFMHGSHFVCE